MTKLHFGWLLASAALAVILLALLFVSSDLDLAAIGRSLLGVRLGELGEIVLLLGVNNALAGEKWRLIALRLPPGNAAAMPRRLYFAFTSIGVALGQIVPAQLSLVLSRSIGAHLHGGRALSRGMAATLFDYFFDVLVAAFFAAASILVLLTGGGERAWMLCATAICLAGFLLFGSAARLLASAARSLGACGIDRLGALGAALALSPLPTPAIGRRLLAISLLRYAVLVQIGAVSAAAIGADLTYWHIAASLPFAVIANALAITPGSLGVNEWTVSSALLALGTPLPVSAEWALVNRVLVAVAAAVWGVAGVVFAAASRRPRPTRAD